MLGAMLSSSWPPCFWGPLPALVAGGLGSALADLLTGYAHWAPWTLVIKGIEGWIAAAIGFHWLLS